jgi:hypothetical protein
MSKLDAPIDAVYFIEKKTVSYSKTHLSGVHPFGEARFCEKLRKIEALFVENSAAARFRARARGLWLRTEALAIELRCGGTRRDGGSGPTGR